METKEWGNGHKRKIQSGVACIVPFVIRSLADARGSDGPLNSLLRLLTRPVLTTRLGKSWRDRTLGTVDSGRRTSL